MISLRAPLGLIVAALAATIALHSAPRSEAAEGERVVIEIRSLKFAPQRPQVNVGDVIVWKNLDIVPHTVTAQDDSWDSGTIESGGEWETTVTEEMIRDYYCRFHPVMTAALAFETQQSATAPAASGSSGIPPLLDWH